MFRDIEVIMVNVERTETIQFSNLTLDAKKFVPKNDSCESQQYSTNYNQRTS